MSIISVDAWRDDVLHRARVHLLQTAEWGEHKAMFGWQPIRLRRESAGAQLLLRKLPLGFTIAYLPKGPLGSPGSDFWSEVDAVCRRHRAIYLQVEPDAWEIAGDTESVPPGSVQSGRFIQPPRTILIDLTPSETEILASMKQKTRYNIRLAEKKGVQVCASGDLAAFIDLMHITGSRDNFGVHSPEYYQRAYELFHPRGLCELFLATFEERALAGLMVFAHHGRAWYLYGASSDESRNLMPTYLLQWAAMSWAKQQGCTEYDLWGIPDVDEATLEAGFTERADGLWGVYRFKRGFGGQVRRAAGPWRKIYQPVLTRLADTWLNRHD